jgi:hypothetical protein
MTRPAAELLVCTRIVLAVFTVLTAVATNQLFLLAADTKDWFAWTIAPLLSAAFVGAGYGAGCVLMILCLRAKSWADVRLSVVTVWIFATLTLIATLSHLGKFHFFSPAVPAKFAAWFWLGIYLVVPIALALTIDRQSRTKPLMASRRTLPAWLSSILLAQGVTMLVVGVTLFIRPSTAHTIWPWALTPLTAQMIAAWLIAFGTAAVSAPAERDLARLRIAAIGYATFGALELIAVVRYRDEINWDAAPALLYVGLLASVVLAGIIGWRMTSALATPFNAGTSSQNGETFRRASTTR